METLVSRRKYWHFVDHLKSRLHLKMFLLPSALAELVYFYGFCVTKLHKNTEILSPCKMAGRKLHVSAQILEVQAHQPSTYISAHGVCGGRLPKTIASPLAGCTKKKSGQQRKQVPQEQPQSRNRT